MSDNTAENLVQTVFDQNYTAATEIFNDMVDQKMQDALEQEKIAVADQIFNGHSAVSTLYRQLRSPSAEGGPEDDDYVVPEEPEDDYSEEEEIDVDIDEVDIDEILDDEDDE